MATMERGNDIASFEIPSLWFSPECPLMDKPLSHSVLPQTYDTTTKFINIYKDGGLFMLRDFGKNNNVTVPY